MPKKLSKRKELTVPLVIHVPTKLKKKIIATAKAAQLPASRWLREHLTELLATPAAPN